MFILCRSLAAAASERNIEKGKIPCSRVAVTYSLSAVPSVSGWMHRENFLPIFNFDGEHDSSWHAMGR